MPILDEPCPRALAHFFSDAPRWVTARFFTFLPRSFTTPPDYTLKALPHFCRPNDGRLPVFFQITLSRPQKGFLYFRQFRTRAVLGMSRVQDLASGHFPPAASPLYPAFLTLAFTKSEIFPTYLGAILFRSRSYSSLSIILSDGPLNRILCTQLQVSVFLPPLIPQPLC